MCVLWFVWAVPFSARTVLAAWSKVRGTRFADEKADAKLDAAIWTVVVVLVHLALPFALMAASPDNGFVDVARRRHVLSAAECAKVIAAAEVFLFPSAASFSLVFSF